MRSRSRLSVISRPPSLPSASSALFCPLMVPWFLAKVSSTLPMQLADHHVGEPREGVAAVPDRMRAPTRNMCSCATLRSRSRKSSRISPICRRALELDLRLVERAEEARLEQRVDRLRIARHMSASRWRGAEDQRHQRDQVGVLLEQREQPLCRAQPPRKRSNEATAASGLSERASRSISSGTSSANWRRANSPLSGNDSARQPVAHRGRWLERLLDPSRRAGRGFRGRRPSRELQGRLLRPSGHHLEQLRRVVPLHLAAAAEQRRRQRVTIQRRKRAKRSSASRSAGKVWVWSSDTI